MSSQNNYDLILSPEAEKDYRDILAYTLRTWGVEQMEKYDMLLDTALITLEKAPDKGRLHPKLSTEYRYYHTGRHYIIYRVKSNTVEVVRILHDQMDIARHIR